MNLRAHAVAPDVRRQIALDPKHYVEIAHFVVSGSTHLYVGVVAIVHRTPGSDPIPVADDEIRRTGDVVKHLREARILSPDLVPNSVVDCVPAHHSSKLL